MVMLCLGGGTRRQDWTGFNSQDPHIGSQVYLQFQGKLVSSLASMATMVHIGYRHTHTDKTLIKQKSENGHSFFFLDIVLKKLKMLSHKCDICTTITIVKLRDHLRP